MRQDRWEYGSDFHWGHPRGTEAVTCSDNIGLYGCGRDALRALLTFGMESRGWRRLWIPAYFCQEVAASILTTGITVMVYQDGPLDSITEPRDVDIIPGDVLFTVAYFGVRRGLSRDAFGVDSVELIEDHSHDPQSQWAKTSRADWCICSLRKTMPIPDGGALWSPLGHQLPAIPSVTNERQISSLQKLCAMALKRLYLEGYEPDKAAFRRLALSGESRLGSGEISGMPEWTRELVTSFPVEGWRKRRYRNYRLLSAQLQDIPGLSVLQPNSPNESCPFSVIMVFDTKDKCATVRQQLLTSNVYAARLWPLDDRVVGLIDQDYVDLSRRMLSIPCDGRYGKRDIERVASLIKACMTG